MGDASDTGLSSVEAPDPYSSRRRYTIGQLVAITRQLKRPGAGWVSDKQEYETRSAANSRAATLQKALAARGVPTKTSTTKLASGKFIWAIRARK